MGGARASGWVSHQILQNLLGFVEFNRAWELHVLHVKQVSDGEVKAE